MLLDPSPVWRNRLDYPWVPRSDPLTESNRVQKLKQTTDVLHSTDVPQSPLKWTIRTFSVPLFKAVLRLRILKSSLLRLDAVMKVKNKVRSFCRKCFPPALIVLWSQVCGAPSPPSLRSCSTSLSWSPNKCQQIFLLSISPSPNHTFSLSLLSSSYSPHHVPFALFSLCLSHTPFSSLVPSSQATFVKLPFH